MVSELWSNQFLICYYVVGIENVTLKFFSRFFWTNPNAQKYEGKQIRTRKISKMLKKSKICKCDLEIFSPFFRNKKPKKNKSKHNKSERENFQKWGKNRKNKNVTLNFFSVFKEKKPNTNNSEHEQIRTKTNPNAKNWKIEQKPDNLKLWPRNIFHVFFLTNPYTNKSEHNKSVRENFQKYGKNRKIKNVTLKFLHLFSEKIPNTNKSEHEQIRTKTNPNAKNWKKGKKHEKLKLWPWNIFHVFFLTNPYTN